jgi:hypothetical protein
VNAGTAAVPGRSTIATLLNHHYNLSPNDEEKFHISKMLAKAKAGACLDAGVAVTG